MLEKHRQQLIKDILDRQQFASVKQLTRSLGASEATIRRDLVKMAERGEINKIRGGAESISGKPIKKHIASSVFMVDKTRRTEVKRSIAKCAAELCREGDSVIINGGSSTYMMGEFLCDMHLHILTNSLVLANYLTENSDNQVSLPGGEIYREQGIVLSANEYDGTEHFKSSMLFIGTPGIGEFGVMESDTMLIKAVQKFRKQADKLVVLVDSSKLGKRSSYVLYELKDIDIMITDSDADIAVVEEFQRQGVNVIIAN